MENFYISRITLRCKRCDKLTIFDDNYVVHIDDYAIITISIGDDDVEAIECEHCGEFFA